MAQEKQLSTITEGKGAIPFSPKVNTSTVYDENGQPLNVVLRSVDGKFKECSHSIGEQREKTEGLQDTINEAALHNGEVQAAVLVNIASGTGECRRERGVCWRSGQAFSCPSTAGSGEA